MTLKNGLMKMTLIGTQHPGANSVSVYYDDDETVLQILELISKDTNENGIVCDIELSLSEFGVFVVEADSFVDEDPDEDKHAKEACIEHLFRCWKTWVCIYWYFHPVIFGNRFDS